MAHKRTREASSSNSRWNHDVFLSFREDAGNKIIIDGLYNDLVQSGIRTFSDDDKHKQEVKTIAKSRIAIVVFSRKYVSSISCLNKLVKILECRLGLILVPVFSDVDPSDVRNQKGSVEEAFARHEEIFKEKMEKMERWRKALKETANLSGWDLQDLADG